MNSKAHCIFLAWASCFWLGIASALGFSGSSPDKDLNAYDEQIVAAAQPGREPEFHGAQIIGIRPDTPFLLALSVSGERSIIYSARHLPAGLKLDGQTGIIKGLIQNPGEYEFIAGAKNAAGKTHARIKIICGNTLALTPPMGWNSYDAFGDSVTESEVCSNAVWMRKNLQPYGWDTVVVDFRWYDSLADGVRVQNPEGVTIDGFGRCIPAVNRFPSAAGGAGFKPLADRIHAMGLKFGIHIMRGIPRKAVEKNLPIADSIFTAAQAVLPENDTNRTCVWNHDMFGVDAATGAGKAWYESLARQYAAWGVDYIKCDDITCMFRGRGYEAGEIEVLSTALKNSGRSIVLSLSPGPTPVSQIDHLKQFANLWRISNDFWDNWKSLNHNFDLFSEWQGKGSPGHWPDGDMIPFGHVCQRNCDVRPGRWTRFTRDEQLTLISLWSLMSSPLMLGMNLPDNDDWTTAVLTNPEILAVDQDVLDRPVRQIRIPYQGVELWTKTLSNTSVAAGFFNRTDKAVEVNCMWQDMGFSASPKVRDLWLRKNLRPQTVFVEEIPAHGCALLKLN